MASASIAIVVGALVAGQMEPLPHLGSLTAELRAPARLAVTPNDSVLVTDPKKGHIVRFDALGDLTGTWPIPGVPVGVAVHPDGRVFVSLRDEPKVAIYDAAMNFLDYLGADDPMVAFVGPTDIDIADNTGRIYVVDADGDRIYGFNGDGTLALILGSRGPWRGQFIYPSAIAVDEGRNRLIVADHDKWSIQAFTTGGVFLQQFGDRLTSAGGVTEGWMPRPQGIAVDQAGNIYLTDALMSTVRVFDPTGAELGKVVEYGYGSGGLRVPCDLDLSRDGSRLYVVSSNSSSVEIYDTSGGVRAAGSTAVASTKPLARSGLRTDVGDDPPDPNVAMETEWNGPHIVPDRPNICWPCHSIRRQPGSHAGTSEGQGMLCMSCHNAGGRALRKIIHEGDIADPFGTNPLAADGAGSSHAWGVPAVNAEAASIGPEPGGTMAQYVDAEGNIKCATCHNQHNDQNLPYLRVDNTGDAMCKECHAAQDVPPGVAGSHPVGFPYPENDGEYPSADALGAIAIKEGMVECLTCHAVHGGDSGGANGGAGDGMLLRGANDETFCRTCHTDHAIHNATGDSPVTCRDCHAMHDVTGVNAALVPSVVNGVPVSFTGGDIGCDAQGDYVHGSCDPPTYDGICEVCHTTTLYHTNAAAGDHVHYTDMPCIECHPHDNGFSPIEGYCVVCHGEPPDGIETPNRAGSHALHLTGANGPHVPDCYTCHAQQTADTHNNGMRSFASGVDANGDGNIELAEADVCDGCHGVDGPIDGVNDPVVGAKANWYDGVYDGDMLKPDKALWCSGCHDDAPVRAEVNGVQAPPVAGDTVTYGDAALGHGFHEVVCTECHNPTLPHTDGIAKTFSERFPLRPGGLPKPPEERELDKEAYNNGYRLRRIDGQRALEIPRDAGAYQASDFALCFSCHDEVQLLGVPANYELYPTPPDYLQLPPGIALTNYRNESPWGFNWVGKPVNAHWRHSAVALDAWDIDQDGFSSDSVISCVTCHNPHGTLDPGGEPTVAMTARDLDITYGVYDDGVNSWQYGYIGSNDFFMVGGDLNCLTCHPWSGPGADPPAPGGAGTRFYRVWLDLPIGN